MNETSGQRRLSTRSMQFGLLLAVVGTIATAFTLDSPLLFGNLAAFNTVPPMVQLLSAIESLLFLFGLPLAAGLICLSMAIKVFEAGEITTTARRRFLIAGLMVGGIGFVLCSYSADILIGFGATEQQSVLFSIASLTSRVYAAFGMPFAAGLICSSIAFSYLRK